MTKESRKNSSTSRKKIVSVGTKVAFLNQDGEAQFIAIVEPHESDINSGKISKNAPVAQALLGKNEGEEAEVLAPGGRWKIRVLKILG